MSIEPTAQPQNGTIPTVQSLQPQNNSPTQSNLPTQPTEPQNPNIEPPQNVHKMQTRAKNNISKLNRKFALTVAGRHNTTSEPTTINQALKSEH